MTLNTAQTIRAVSDRREPSGSAQPLAPITVLQAVPAIRERLTCLDAYRGFVILIMTWVNFIGEMPGIPDWLKHAPATQDGFTFPDLVFPGFLFIVGIAIPLAIGKIRDTSVASLPVIGHICGRAFGLLLAGVMLVNAPRYDADISLLPRALYCVLLYVSMILLWKQGTEKKSYFWIGAALMAFLMVTFRGKTDVEFHSVYLETSWWGILGMIGWTYLCCSLVYVATRGSSTALMGVLGFMIAVYMGGHEGMLDFIPDWIEDTIGIGTMFGSVSANVLAGTLIGNLFLETRISATDDPATQRAIHRRRLKFMFFFAAGLVLAGVLLRPYHHISKIGATESFTLVCGGINLFAFSIFYFLMDVMQWRTWAAFLVPAGINALFAYILPDLWRQVLDMLGLGDMWWRFGWPFLQSGGPIGLINAAVVAMFMFSLVALASRKGLRLKF